MSQPEAVDLTQKYVQHLRTKHVIYACRICESQPKFRERALALNHLKKTHKDEFPADREKAEAFTTRSLLHIDKSECVTWQSNSNDSTVLMNPVSLVEARGKRMLVPLRPIALPQHVHRVP